MISSKGKRALKGLFDWHEYEVSKEKINEICQVFEKSNPKITDEKIIDFIEQVKSGKFGVLYKTPTSITSMFYKHFLADKELLEFHKMIQEARKTAEKYKNKNGYTR